MNIYSIYSASSATTLGYTVPVGASWSYPIVSTNPQIIISEGFGKLIGFSAGSTYGLGSSYISIKSNKTPQIAVVNTLLIHTNLLNQELTAQPNIIDAMAMSGDYGSLLIKNNASLLYSNVSPNNYNEIVVFFTDQNFNKLKIKDTEVCIILSIIDI